MFAYNCFLSSRESNLVIIYFLFLLFLCRPVWAQPSMSDGPETGQKLSPSMGLLFIVLIVSLFFIGVFTVYVRRCTAIPTTQVGPRARHSVTGSVVRSRRGLDPAIIETFPTFDYFAVKTAKIGRGALECAVCLTEFEDDATLRLIPKCDHVFHPECIDTWLAGHTTCPVCRANLSEPAGSDTSSSTPRDHTDLQNDIVLEISENGNNIINDDVEESESMEQPLRGRVRRTRSMVGNLPIGRPGWIGKFNRSFSTGHVAVNQLENTERFTLRLPNEIRNQIMSGKLGRSTSLVILPGESSTKKGYRLGHEGISKGRSSSVRSDRIITRSDQWIFSLAPPFISITSITTSHPKDVVCDSSKGGTGTLRGSIRDDSSMLPV
ncbi:hypothetical protein RND81_04G009200 [Saponaria officinalis]|uniref:RING-type E3 ubiquitin transferase n=1 Tax=Saponaria officinalis TaxID=3572 RepID=A0AAW1LH99_SAPOF